MVPAKQSEPIHPEDLADVFLSWISKPSSPPKTQNHINSPELDIGDQLINWISKPNLNESIFTKFTSTQSNFIHDTIISGSFELNPTTDYNIITVKTKHWETETQRKNCYLSNCQIALGIKNGRVNCSKCGRLCCNSHSTFQMRLDKNAERSLTGCWSRVCRNCFENYREWFDGRGVIRIRTASFKKLRTEFVSRTLLEVNKIEKRLKKVTIFDFRLWIV
jgi:hypothetical protein